MKKALVPVGLIAAALAASVAILNSQSTGVTLHIRQICVPMEEIKMSIGPHETNSAYYTNYGGTNLVASGTANLTAIVGNVIEVYWDMQPDPVILQQSPDLQQWYDIRVVLVGVSNYFTPIDSNQKFFRLKL